MEGDANTKRGAPTNDTNDNANLGVMAQSQSMADELRVETDTEWAVGQPSPRRVATAPTSPATAYATDREAVFRSGHATVAETHLLRSSGSQSQSFTEEHWSSEITSFVAAAPPKFIQVIKAYRVLTSDTPTLVVEVASEPPAIFEWFCNDKPVQQDRRRFQARHGLNITTLTVTQPEQGVYKCTARNPAGCSTSYGYITVNFEHRYADWSLQETSESKEATQRERSSSVTYNQAPRFISQVPNLTVAPGSEAVIDVEVDANPPARFSWFVNGREFRDSSDNVQLFYPKENRCVARFAIPQSGEYKVVASNNHGSAMSSGYIEIYQAKPSKQMRPPAVPGEHLSRTMMTSSQHADGHQGEQPVTTHQMTSVYEVNYSQRASSVPRGVRHLERHVEVATSPERKPMEALRAESRTTNVAGPSRLPRALHKTRSDGGRYLPHPPKFLTELPSSITVQPNEKLVLSVDVSAIPTADFKWNVNGFEVKPTKNVTLLNEQNRSTLVVNPPVKQGKYNVTASNDAGRDTLMTRVIQTVTETREQIESEIRITSPVPPGVVESAVTVTSAHDEWEVVDDGASDPSTTSFETVLKTEKKKEIEEEKVPETQTPVKEQETRPLTQEVTTTIEETTVTANYSKDAVSTKTASDMPRKPMLTEPPIQHIHVLTGDVLVLESRATAVPAAEFQWYVNNFEVKSGQFVVIEQTDDNQSRATFLRPAPGQYKVIATNEHGRVEGVTRVTTEVVEESVEEKTTVTTTTVSKPVMFKLTRKKVSGRDDLPRPPTIVEKLPQVIRIGEQEELTLTVVADAIPEAVFTWMINNFEVKCNQNVTVTKPSANTSQIVFKKAGPGKYEAIAKNDMGQDSSACKVIVEYEDTAHRTMAQGAPVVVQALPVETTTTGEETRLVVTVAGAAPMEFTWFEGEEEIKDAQTVVEGNRSILILRRPLREGAVISVMVKNREGTVKSQTSIKSPSPVAEQASEPKAQAPVFVKALSDLVLEEGQPLRCEVGVATDCAPCVFEWSMNHETLEISPGVVIQSSTHHSQLNIESLCQTESLLTAVARNAAGTAASSAILSVVARDEPFEMVPPDLPEECAPKILEPLHSSSFRDGQPMVLRCRIHADPSAAIVWSKDDIDVEEWVINKDVTTQILPGGVCELLNPECYPEDSGLYKCHASNPHGTAETAAYISVEGMEYEKDREEASLSESVATSALMLAPGADQIILPPKFVEELSAETDAVKQLGYIRLVCRVVSAAPMTITWWKENEEISQSDKFEIYQFDDGAQILTVHQANDSDNGVYTCKAESEHGLSSSSCEVIVPDVEEEIKEEVMVEKEIKETSVDLDIEIVPTPSPEEKASYEIREDSTLADVEIVEKTEEGGVTEIHKPEEEYKLLVKVAESVASALVAHVFVDAVREAARVAAEASSEEEEFVSVESGCPPRYDACPEGQSIVEGNSARISTTVHGHPTPFVEWYFKEERITVNQNLSMSYDKGVASLNIGKVSLSDEGTYYCHATNMHGTTVLSSRLTVLPKEADANIRISLANYDKQEGLQKVVTNVIAKQPEKNQEKSIEVAERVVAKDSITLRVDEEEQTTDVQIHLQQQDSQDIMEAELMKELQMMGTEEVEKKEIPSTPSPIPKIILPDEVSEEDRHATEAEQQLRNVAERFAESFTDSVMTQARDIVITGDRVDESAESWVNITRSTVLMDKAEESGRRSVTMEYEEKVKVIEDRLQAAASPQLTAEDAVNMVMNTVMSMKEQHICDETTTVDVRSREIRFDHVVTVVEPELVQLGVRLRATASAPMKFIDIDSILQKPSTSSSTVLIVPSRGRRNASAEHRIVLLQGASQNFQDAMTWSLKKMQRLACEADLEEPSSDRREMSVTSVESESIVPELLQMAAAASKLKMENVTVSLVRQGDTSQQQLVIEYESRVEDDASLEVEQLQCSRQTESREEVWSRRSRFSEEDENVVAVFMEVDATCPDQSVEIVATVNTPMSMAALPSTTSFDVAEVSQRESVTDESSVIGTQPPKFFRKLTDCQAVVGNAAQFKCIVSGTPTPDVIWSVDGDAIQQNQEYSMVYEDGVCILRINEVLPEDEGEYCCEAMNAIGKVSTKCFLKVVDQLEESASAGRNEAAQAFFEHTPTASEIVEHELPLESELEPSPDRDSLSSFERQERKINAEMDAENADPVRESQNIVVYNSNFDLSRICSYNEDMKESNAFHKYFETAETVVKVTELVQEEFVGATFKATTSSPLRSSTSTSTTDAFFMNTKKNAAAIATTKVQRQESFAEAESPRFSVTSQAKLWDTEFEDPFAAAMEDHSIQVEESRLYEPRTPILPMKMSYKGQEIGISVNEIKKQEAVRNQQGELKVSTKTCTETSLDFDASLNPPKKIQLKDTAVTPSTNQPESTSLDPKISLNQLAMTPAPGAFGSPEFVEKMREVERIAKNVEKELSSLSRHSDYTSGSELSDDAKEIEKAILQMSDHLMLQKPVSEAQAEASEELLRTTLADMILNPSRTAEEEIELMKRPIQLLKRKLSDIENSLMEDVEVKNITEAQQEGTSMSASTATPATVVSPLHTQRIPSAELIRMTPLTSNIKEQLTSLEQLINEHVNSESPTESKEISKDGKSPTQKRRELHDIFVQINNEINTIRSYCSKKLTNKGSEAVMAVLHKVRTHVTSIVNVMALAKKKKKKEEETADTSIRYHFKRAAVEEKAEGVVVFKRSSLESSFVHSTTQPSSGAVSTSDDTWRYSSERMMPANSDLKSKRSTSSRPEDVKEEELTPIAPPRRSRSGTRPEPVNIVPVSTPPSKASHDEPMDKTSASGTEHTSTEVQEKVLNAVETKESPPPIAPPRKKRETRKRDHSLDSKRQFSCLPRQSPKVLTKHHSLDNREDVIPMDWDEPPAIPQHKTLPHAHAPTKPRRSFTGNALEFLRHLNISNPLKKKIKDTESEEEHLLSDVDLNVEIEEDKSELQLLEELKSMSTHSTDAPPRERELTIEERETPILTSLATVDTMLPLQMLQEHEPSSTTLAEPTPVPADEWTHVSFGASAVDAAFTESNEMMTESQVPDCHRICVDCFVPMDDISSVQMLCEESDYATDTDTSCMLKGTVQFFNRYSPLDQKQRSNNSLNVPTRHSQQYADIVEDAEENVVDVVVNIDLRSADAAEADEQNEEAEFSFNDMIVYESDLDSRSESEYRMEPTNRKTTGLSTILEQSGETAKSKSDDQPPIHNSNETIHMILEETQLSQMGSSVRTQSDATERNLLSPSTLRETDILSDDSVATELHNNVSEIDAQFEFSRLQAKRRLLAIVSQEVKQQITATLAEDSTFDVEIEQEPETLALVIKVIEDQVDFTSLTVIANYEGEYSDHLDVPARECEGDITETSSFDEYEGDDPMRTGITVSIIARSLHDGIYASLEEIPWGEVKMTLKECDVMTRSHDNSVQFNVTVSESTAEEKKSLKSQASFKESQNTISEMENTLSTGSINIPSYIIKEGSTATITCELNNYLPPDSDIEWYKGKEPLERQPGRVDRISHDLLEVLIINAVDANDNDLYSLRVNDDLFPVAYLLIEDSMNDIIPMILSPPQTQFVMDGQPTELAVQVTTDAGSVEWLKDRRPLEGDLRISVIDSDDGWSRLVFSETRIADQGTYFAVLNEMSVALTLVVEERIDEKEVTVVASGTESDDDDVQEYLVPPGSTATIACELEQSEQQRDLVWLKNGRAIIFGDANKMEHVVNGLKHYLVIHDTKGADSGLYSVSISGTEFRVAHLAVNDLATGTQGLRRKRISNNSLHK